MRIDPASDAENAAVQRAPLVAHKLVTDLSRSNHQTHSLTSEAIRTTFVITLQPAHDHLPTLRSPRSTPKRFHESYRHAGGASATG
jgi:hypothetical protein